MKWNVFQLCMLEEWKVFKLTLKNAELWRLYAFPMGHICTFVPNEKSLKLCFSVLWNEALVVIKLIPISLQLIQFLGEMKATGNMFWISSITLIWAQRRSYDFGPLGAAHLQQKRMFSLVIKGFSSDAVFPVQIWWQKKKKNRPRTFILLKTLNVETLEIAYWSVNKCQFDITLSF